MCSSSIFKHIIGNAVAILNSLSIVTVNMTESITQTRSPMSSPEGVLHSLLFSKHSFFRSQLQKNPVIAPSSIQYQLQQVRYTVV